MYKYLMDLKSRWDGVAILLDKKFHGIYHYSQN